MRLENKVALITGAGSGIGRETALLFAAEGAKVLVADLDRDSADDTRHEIGAAGGDAVDVAGDVSDGDDAARMVQAALNSFGTLDVLVNSAGVTARAAGPGESAEAVWDRVVGINLKGTYLVTWNAVPEMTRAGGGSIITLGSIAALVGLPAERRLGFDPYPSSKGGVLQFTRNLAVDVARHNIRVNCICPGHLHTPLTEELTSDPEMLESLVRRYPLGRLGRPKEIAYAALYLASDESSYVTGTSLAVDGGYTAQ